MIPKTQCCINAVSHGVERAYIIDGRKKYLLLSILHRNDGGGTMFVRRLKP
jgi:acetylglutamate kinase